MWRYPSYYKKEDIEWKCGVEFPSQWGRTYHLQKDAKQVQVLLESFLEMSVINRIALAWVVFLGSTPASQQEGQPFCVEFACRLRDFQLNEDETKREDIDC